MKPELTEKQQEILNYIKDFILNRGFPPTVREIGQAVGLSSTSSIHLHLESLIKKGYIRKDPAKPRTIEITDETLTGSRREITHIPMVGRVAAGEPILADENISGYFPIPVDYLPNTETFMLKVRGDSMINVGIYDGDDIIVAKQETAKNGEIVVALVDDSATVKRFYKEKNYYRLQPENDSLEPIITDHVSILGKVIGLLRFM